jgi:hypothetical protein
VIGRRALPYFDTSRPKLEYSCTAERPYIFNIPLPACSS